MPSLRDLEVHVTDKDGHPLAEYGVQKITKANLVSCFIESKADTPFQVSVKRTMPFPGLSEQRLVEAPEQSTAGSSMKHQDGGYYNGEAWDDALKGRYFGEEEDWGDDIPTTGIAEWRKNLGTAAKSEDEDPAEQFEQVEPFQLLATMRLDGREKFEKQVIVYLDDGHPNYARYYQGQAYFRSRLAYDLEGKIRESGWMFKEVGIDDLLSAMGIGSEDDEVGEAVPLPAEDELTQAFGKMGEGRLEDKKEGKVGQIEITLEKIRVGTTKRGAWKPLGDSATDAAAGSKPNLKDVTHTVGRDISTRTVTSVDAIFYEKIEEGEYATFRFYYRSAETLGRFGFTGFATGAQSPSATKKGVLAASKLASSSGAGKKGRRGRGEEEEDEGPAKEGRWEMSLAVRGARGGMGMEASGEGVGTAAEEDEEL